MIHCLDCQLVYPDTGLPYLCPDCGGIFGLQGIDLQPEFLTRKVKNIWTFRETFRLPVESPEITLGEGNTPLVWEQIADRNVGLKLEHLNPSGSFKDRGTAVLVSRLAGLGIKSVVEDSSGNAGASLAAYTARAGIQARIFTPSKASGPKKEQIQRSGAELVMVEGPRQMAADAVRRAAAGGEVYASHAYLPLGLPGIATIAYELYRDLGQVPGCICVPVGHGSLLLGVYHGFKALLKAGVTEKMPVLIGIQAASCDPLVQAFEAGSDRPLPVEDQDTLASGVRIVDPPHGPEILQAVRASRGGIIRVEEQKIEAGQGEFARKGIDLEYTAALLWDGLHQVIRRNGNWAVDPVIGITTGHGLKNS